MRRLFRTKLREWRPRLARLGVVKNGVALTESAAPRILPAQAYARPIERQRAERHRFRERPIERHSAFAHLRAARELAHHFRIQIEAFRHDGNLLGDSLINLGGKPVSNKVRASS